jgi:hypothetical protein
MDFDYSFVNLADLLKQKLSNLSTSNAVQSTIDEIKQASEADKNGDSSMMQNAFNKYF